MPPRRLPLKLTLLVCLAVFCAAGQGAAQTPVLFVGVDDSGTVDAWLHLFAPMPESTRRAFAQAIGCSAPDPLRSTSVHVACPAAVRKDGLRWSAHWDFTALAAELIRSGAGALEIHINHSRSAFSRLEPPLPKLTGNGFTVSYRGEVPLRNLHSFTLEAGIGESQIWRVAATAATILLLPLILIPLRGNLLLIVAASHALFVAAATAWLWALLPVHAAAFVPLPYYFAIVFLPMALAVWIGSRMAGSGRGRALFWRGIVSTALLTVIIGIFTAVYAIFLWSLCSIAVVLVAIWRMRSGGMRRRQIREGELFARAQELAARAGTTLRSVQVITGGEDLPGAFASRFRDVLLTGGLLASSPRREVDAIVCHELSHLRRPGYPAARANGLLLVGALILAFVVPSLLAWLPLVLPAEFLLQRANRRRRELRADADAVAWSGDAEALIEGLARVSRASGMPLAWPGWVRPLMPHPPTLDRVRAVARQAAIPEARLEELLAAGAAASPADRYQIPEPPPAGTAFTPEARARLNTALTLVALAIPIAFGVAAVFVGFTAAVLLGAIAAVVIPEWTLWRTRMRVRNLLAGRPGLFCGFSPSAQPRVYDGYYDYDWGFAAFENGALVFRGDRTSWSIPRSAVAQIQYAAGPFHWVPRSGVSFSLHDGESLCLRPFDGAFGPAASRAAAALLREAARWHATPSTAGAQDNAAGRYDFASVKGDPPPPYTWGTLLRGMPRYAVITFAMEWMVLAAQPGNAWADPWRLVGPPAVTAALTAFMAYPGVRRGRGSAPSPSAAPQSRAA